MDLKSSLQTLWNQRWTLIIVLAAGLVLGLVISLRVHTAYTANASVLMVPTSTSDNATGTTTGTKPLLSADLPMLAQTNAVLDGISRDMGGAASPQILMRRIRTDVYLNSNVMTIRYTGGSPQQAIHGANLAANEVVRYYRSIATTRFDSLAADLNQQLARRQGQLQAIDAQLEKATAAYPFIQYGAGASDATSINAMLVRLQDEREGLAATLSGDAAQAGVTGQRTIETAPLARQELANQDPLYRNVDEQYGRDAAQLRQKQEQFASTYPGLPELQDIVNRERTGLTRDQRRIAAENLAASLSYSTALADENKARSLVANDRAKLQQLDRTLAALRNELTGSPALGGITVAALRRDRESAESAYQLLSNRLITTLADRAAAASTGSLMVFDRASYAKPVPYTLPVVILVACMIAALWIAITLAFLLEALDRRFRTPAAIENVYGSPVLGVI